MLDDRLPLADALVGDMSMLWTVLKYYVVGVLALIAIEAALVGIALLLCELDAYRDSCRTVTRWEFAGQSDAPDMLEPNTMGVILMKSRNYGSKEGMRINLAVEHGRVTHLPERERYGTSYDRLRQL